MEDLLLTGDEVAAVLKVNKATVYSLMNAGRIPRPVKIGGSSRWRGEEVRNWVKAGCPVLEKWVKFQSLDFERRVNASEPGRN